MDDSTIVELFLSRDEAAIKETEIKYGARLKAIAFGVLKDAQASEECVSDAYMEAWELIPPNEPREYLFAFLAKAVRNIAVDRLRRDSAKKRSANVSEFTREMEECIPGGSVESEAEANELGRLINAFLLGLPENKRMLFVRRYWYFDSVEALEKRFGYSKSKVKTELFRTRKKLAEYLKKEGYEV